MVNRVEPIPKSVKRLCRARIQGKNQWIRVSGDLSNRKLIVSPATYSVSMSGNQRQRLSSLACPKCLEVGSLRKILYGMPDPETFDFEKYAVGGCCMSPDGIDPDIKCGRCDWSGYRDAMEEK